MARVSGKTIISFLNRHYEAIETLFENSKNDNFRLNREMVLNHCEEKNVDVQKLLEYKILRMFKDGSYEINLPFSEFMSFLKNDFRLDLPEGILKYKQAIDNIFEKLQKNKDYNETIKLMNGLVHEIKSFSMQVKANQEKLFEETNAIKNNKEQLDYIQKVKKARDLTDQHIKPLNDILNKEHSTSFVRQLRQVGDYANFQRNNHESLAIRTEFDKLYHQVTNIIDDVLLSNAIIGKEITPLIKQLEMDNLALKGIEIYLQYIRNGEKVKHFPKYELKNSRKRTVYASDFGETARILVKDIIEEQNAIPIEVNLELEEDISPLWIFDRQRFRTKLLNDLPIDNFYQWCWNELSKEVETINIEKYFYLSSLLFETDIQADFNTQRFEIDLEDYTLQVPMVQVSKTIVNDKKATTP